MMMTRGAWLPSVLFALQTAAGSPPSPGVLATQLDTAYQTDPAAAIPVALQLAASSDPRAHELVVAWIHDSLALDFAPLVMDRARTPAHDALLSALARSTDGEPSISAMTSPLRMWVSAQRMDDPA